MFTQLIDALTAPHGADRYLEILRPTWSRNDPRAEIVAVERRGTGSVTLRLRPNASWGGFRAGQFIQVGVEIGGVRETRCYSPACSELSGGTGNRGGEIEITVRAHPEGRVSNHLHEHARPGMFVELSEADGDFVLPASRPERLLLISGGSGITPVISMLRTLRDEGHEGEIVFLHYSPSLATTTYDAELAAIAGSRAERPRHPRPHPYAGIGGARRPPDPRPPRARRRRSLDRRRLRLRAAGADRGGALDLSRGRARRPPPRRELPAPHPRDRDRRRRGHDHLCRERRGRRQRRPDAARAGRGRRPQPRRSDAGWASATRAPARRPPARCETRSPERSPTPRTRTSRSASRCRSTTVQVQI